MSPVFGQPVSRVDGRAKVTGSARYTAEVVLPGLCHAALIWSTVPSGRIVTIDTGVLFPETLATWRGSCAGCWMNPRSSID